MTDQKIAIIGTGPAGLACGYLLNDRYDITLFERNDYIGGHANTLTTEIAGETIHTDSAFVVFNSHAYPLFNRMLRELDVASVSCPMSFGFQIAPIDLTYHTLGLTYCFCDTNILKPRFAKMLFQMWRFYRDARQVLRDEKYHELTIGEYVAARGYGDDFLHHFFIPLLAVVWSLPPQEMMQHPILTMVEFLENHGALQGVLGRKRWMTVVGGSRRYVDKICAGFRDRIKLNCGVTRVSCEGGQIRVADRHGATHRFDKVVFACHADQALRMLDTPSKLEQTLLGRFRYHPTRVVVHTDRAIMPRSRRHWAGWNYLVKPDAEGEPGCCFTYYMNKLQKVSKKTDVFVTINDGGRVEQSKILNGFEYEHPIFDLAAMQAQKRLHELNENGSRYFCGSYFKFGFHEDAFRSGVEVCRKITGQNLWGE